MPASAATGPGSAETKRRSSRVFSRRVAPFVPVALALLAQTVAPTTPVRPTPQATLESVSKACEPDLASCPEIGCAAADSPHALANTLKRRQLSEEGASPILLTFDDLHQLQDEALKLVGDTAGDLTAQQRDKLHDLPLASASGQVSEGDLVQVMGFVVGTPHANTGESVNCNLHGEPNNDFHIPISDQPQSSFSSPKVAEFSAVVVEMIPQDRSAGWTLPRLDLQRDDAHAILVTGQLFYDNLHHPNGDAKRPLAGQPRRFALWEIHPVGSFKICTLPNNGCSPANPDGWMPLEQVKADDEVDTQ
jgi:hypothetical protein